MNNIFQHGSSQTEHDERVEKVQTLLQEKGMKLHRVKCDFNMLKF